MPDIELDAHGTAPGAAVADAYERGRNLRAFLKLIRWAEHYPTGGAEQDYYRIFGGDIHRHQGPPSEEGEDERG